MASEIVEYLRKPESLERFANVLGNVGRANRYIQSVAIAVASNDDLFACTPRSILSAALRCASLQLSCDPATRQGQLVPFKNYKTGEMEAALIIHYVGLIILAERTNKYRTINVREIYEGWEIMENVYTGLHAISVPGIGRLEDGYMPRWNMKDTPVIGYLGFFETHKGFKKSIYMTTDEIEAHARQFSKGYNHPKSLWKDPKHRPTMQMKTVVRALAKWMDLGSNNDALTQALEDFENDPYDYDLLDNGCQSDIEIIPEDETETHTEEELLGSLGFDGGGNGQEIKTELSTMMSLELAMAETGSDGKRYGDCSNDELAGKSIGIGKALTKKNLSQKRREQLLFKQDAIKVILAARSELPEPPAA